ncbi:MAG: hypothetical protein ABEJ65_01950, partial [bacterium]
MKITRTIVCCLIVFFVVFGIGCSSTGRGDFPTFKPENAGDLDLAVMPTMGAISHDLQSSILYHLDRNGLEQTYKSVEFIPAEKVRD